MDMFKFVLKTKLKKIRNHYLKGEVQDNELCPHYDKAYNETLKLIQTYKEKCNTEK